MASLGRHLLLLGFKLAYFVEHNISYQPSNFQPSRMSGSDFIEERLKNTPQCLIGTEKPSAFRVKRSKKNQYFKLLEYE